MSKCPLCFSDLDPTRARFHCANSECSEESTAEPLAEAYLGNKFTVKQHREEVRPSDFRGTWRPSGHQFCTSCGHEMERACPVCRYQIPQDIGESDVTCVALAGARATGKSVSIGVMRLFLEKLIEELRSSLNFEQRYSRTDEREEYIEQILTGNIYPPTPPGTARSVMYSLGQIGGKRRYLAIRDIAGEDLEVNSSRINLSFLGRADLIIFLFDPLAIRSIRDALENLIPPQERPSAEQEPQRVLQNVLRYIASGRPHLAVCLAKVDALQTLAGHNNPISPVFANPGTTLVRESTQRTQGAGPGYDVDAAELLSEEVRSTLMLLNGTVIVNMVENPANKTVLPHRFFATSALGDAANGQVLPPRGITPFRVLDPLLWIFHKKGIIPAIVSAR